MTFSFGQVAHGVRDTFRRLDPEDLPAWPFALPFVGYGPAWLLGLGDMIWPIAAGLMLALLVRTRDVRVPPWFGLWLLFLTWVFASMVAVDTPGRLIGAAYRGSLYVAATVIAVYAYNAIRAVSVRYVCGVMVIFLAAMAVFGYLALAFPLVSIRTPLGVVLPQSIQGNELVRDMVERQLTQFNPESWEQTSPRPSAPFLYTNTWGNVFSLVFPLVVLYAWRERRSARGAMAFAVSAASIIPAFLTLNRGMFVGLGVVALFLVVRGAAAGRWGTAAVLFIGSVALGVLTVLSPVGRLLSERLASGSSTEDRGSLYGATLVEALRAPVFGYGAPRPAAEPWLPALGTQGQLWTVLFSHGVLALCLFLLWFTVALMAGWRRSDHVTGVLTGVVAATVVETVFYGMMTGLNISLLASTLLFRPHWSRTKEITGRTRKTLHNPPSSQRA